MICDRCDLDFEEKDIQEHHVHPRFMDNPKGKGRKAYLCEKCHNILHLTIPKLIWNNVKDKEKVIFLVEKYTKHYCKIKEEENDPGDT